MSLGLQTSTRLREVLPVTYRRLAELQDRVWSKGVKGIAAAVFSFDDGAELVGRETLGKLEIFQNPIRTSDTIDDWVLPLNRRLRFSTQAIKRSVK